MASQTKIETQKKNGTPPGGNPKKKPNSPGY